ncbi:MAG: nucleoside 2-deoxyribosyltransferase [Deltaproteobacteria bacterium]|nr:nucleoside 2-deoxyribosyltransferase [Deltaproteobacteria bacterium]
MKKIYCAGPLFNPTERADMQAIAESLENAGYEVFLPHRDGIEFSKLNSMLMACGYSSDKANSLLTKAIFYIDTYQIDDSDGLVLNMNGRVPDEGAMVEAGIAWALEKPIVIYKNDSRSLLSGIDNPLVIGLSNFNLIDNIQKIPVKFNQLFSNGFSPNINSFTSQVNTYITRGKKLFEIYADSDGADIAFDELIDLLDGKKK